MLFLGSKPTRPAASHRSWGKSSILEEVLACREEVKLSLADSTQISRQCAPRMFTAYRMTHW